MSKRRIPLLFVDLDGTVRKGLDELGRFVNTPDDVEIFPEAIEMMRAWKWHGGRIVGVTNQGGFAMGHVSGPDLDAIHQRTHEASGELFDGMEFCPHHPDSPDMSLRSCWCRKPSPGMLFHAIFHLEGMYPDEQYPLDSSWMIGDRDEDREAGKRAGVNFMHAQMWRNFAGEAQHRTTKMMDPHVLADQATTP